MSIKLIASDLDGTLMAPDHQTVTERTVAALKAAHDRGVKIAVATGRPLALIDSVLRQIPFTDYVIYSNGACVYDRNAKKTLLTKLVDNETAISAVKYFLTLPVFFEIYVNGRSCYQLGTQSLFSNMGLPDEFIDEVASTMDGYEELVSFLEENGTGMEKITFYGVPDELAKQIGDKLDAFGLNCAVSLPGTMEATAKAADKGSALRGICDETGIYPDEVMSFGDAGNDCPMLEFAKYSFAMENGMDICKKAAKAVTKSNALDGVAVMVEKYCLS